MTKAEEFQISEIPSLNGRVAIVTGGHGGIGFETTRLLAEHGARVYIAGRSEARVNEAISRMKSSKSSLDVRFLEFDLQDLESIKAATTEFMQKESRLDILINNAGIMASPFEITKDGYEIQWQTNFLAHHALTLCLLPIFRQTAQLNPGGRATVRIVNVASDLALNMGPKSIDYKDPDLSDLTGRLAPWKRYGHSKQATIIAAKAINDRYGHLGIAAYSLHPGIIKTGLQSHDPGLFGAMTRIAMKVVPTATPIDGSRTSLYCATSPKAATQGGMFFVPFGKADTRPDKWLNDPSAVNKLWDLGLAQLTKKSGFHFEL